MQTIVDIAAGSWDTFLILAPLFLLGLVIAGLMNMLISRNQVQRFMGGEGLRAVTTSAAFGVPLPICSCGVVPVAMALRDKGASRPALLSFLITTPESGADSILVTWGLLGPVMAIYRPFASFLNAIIAGVLAIALLDPREMNEARAERDENDSGEGCCDTLAPEDECTNDDEFDSYIGFSGLAASAKAAASRQWDRFRAWRPLAGCCKPPFYPHDEPTDLSISKPPGVVALGEIGRRVFRYSFVKLADDIVFSLVIGVLLAGVILVLMPANLDEYGLGGGLKAYLIMLVAGIPLYMCASASTPVATALLAKGLSPGAALVFLLAGPATNTATLVILTKRFGTRFVSIYLGSIVAGSILAGYLLDILVVTLGISIIPNFSGKASGLLGAAEWVGAILLIVLIVWRFANGAATEGLREITVNLRRLIFPLMKTARRLGDKTKFSLKSGWVWALLLTVILGLLLSRRN